MQLATKLAKNQVPDWLTRKEKRRMYSKIKANSKLQKTSRFKRIKKQIIKQEKEKLERKSQKAAEKEMKKVATD